MDGTDMEDKRVTNIGFDDFSESKPIEGGYADKLNLTIRPRAVLGSEIAASILKMNAELANIASYYATHLGMEFDIHIHNDALKPAKYNPVTTITTINGVKLGKAQPNPA